MSPELRNLPRRVVHAIVSWSVAQRWLVLLACLLLTAYALLQSGRARADALPYLLLNFLGALLLAVDAVRSVQWGFIVLECAWALFTLPGLWRSLVRAAGGGR